MHALARPPRAFTPCGKRQRSCSHKACVLVVLGPAPDTIQSSPHSNVLPALPLQARVLFDKEAKQATCL